MSTSSSKKKLLQNTVAVDIGCSCGRPKLSSFFFPKLKTKTLSTTTSSSSSSITISRKPDPYPSSSSPSMEYDSSTTPFQSESEKSVTSGLGRVGESIAVVKDSNDPYHDFRHSMLQMILEKEIYSKEELKELLDCFLSLNSTYHHEIIIRAFTEIWNGVFSMGQGFSAVSSRVRYKSRDF